MVSRTLVLKIIFVWTVVSLLLFNVYFFAAGSYLPLYYNFILLLVGIPMWRYRHIIGLRLRSWAVPTAIKFILLGYGMVLFEEFFAALVNNFNEGFSFWLWILRILQFWAFNVIGFSPMIIGWYILASRLGFSRVELLVLGGLWGIYAEKALLYGPVSAIFYAPIAALVYAVIIGPSILSLPCDKKSTLPMVVRYLLGDGVVFLLTVSFVGTLMVLRSRWPGAFPPCEFIAC